MLRRNELRLINPDFNYNMMNGHGQAVRFGKKSLLDEIISNSARYPPPPKFTAIDSSSSSSQSTLSYLIYLLSSLLMLVGWIGTWVSGVGNIIVETTTPQTTTTSEMPIPLPADNPLFKISKYGCAFGFQGRLCDRKRNHCYIYKNGKKIQKRFTISGVKKSRFLFKNLRNHTSIDRS